MLKVDKVPYLDLHRTHKKIMPELKKSLEKVISSGSVIMEQAQRPKHMVLGLEVICQLVVLLKLQLTIF